MLDLLCEVMRLMVDLTGFLPKTQDFDFWLLLLSLSLAKEKYFSRLLLIGVKVCSRLSKRKS